MFNLFTELLLLNNCPISSVLLYRNGPELTSPDFFYQNPKGILKWIQFLPWNWTKNPEKIFVICCQAQPQAARCRQAQERQLLRVRLIYSVSGNSARKTSNYYQKWPKSTTKIVFKVINSTAFISGILNFWFLEFL